MLHILEKLFVNIIFPALFIGVEVGLNKSRGKTSDYKNITLKWLVFWVIGIGALSAGLMQAFNPTYTANLLQVKANDLIMIRELGYAQSAMGVLGVLSIWYHNYRKPSAIVFGIYIFCCTLIHLTRIEGVNIGELISTIADIWIVIVSAVEIWVDKNKDMRS